MKAIGPVRKLPMTIEAGVNNFSFGRRRLGFLTRRIHQFRLILIDVFSFP
jgi:hypothetical protein